MNTLFAETLKMRTEKGLSQIQRGKPLTAERVRRQLNKLLYPITGVSGV